MRVIGQRVPAVTCVRAFGELTESCSLFVCSRLTSADFMLAVSSFFQLDFGSNAHYSSRFRHCSCRYVHAGAICSGMAARLEVASDAKSSCGWLRSITGVRLSANHSAGSDAGAMQQAVGSSRAMHVQECPGAVTQPPHTSIPIDVEAPVTGARISRCTGAATACSFTP